MSLFDWGEVNAQLSPLEELCHEILDKDASYDASLWTYGSEWEKADIPRDIKLPEGLSWDYKDQTVMNSNGVATDPGKNYDNLTCKFGGELNTKPYDTIQELVHLHESLVIACNGQIAVNNSCNLHNHIRVPDLDLLGLQKIVAYFYLYRDDLAEISDYIPTVAEQGFSLSTHTAEEMKVVEKRYKHHKTVTRHGELNESIVEAKLRATTEEEFHSCGGLFGNLGDKQPNGKNCSLWSNHPRAGINTIQMRRKADGEFAESGTVEFRMHHGTNDSEEFRCTLEWDHAVMDAALNTSENPRDLFTCMFKLEDRKPKFPKYIPMDPELYLGVFVKTKHGKNKRKDIEEAIKLLKHEGKL